MSIYGYARCSTNEDKQDITRQTRELKELGVLEKNIYFEYESGKKTDRIQLNRLLEIIKKGDTIISSEVSRITRSTKQLCEIIEIAKNKEIKLILGNFVVDCTRPLDAMTEGMLKMMGVFSELETNMISQRVISGLNNAVANGKKLGRRETTIEDIPENVKKFFELFQKGKINKNEYSKMCSISRPSLNKYITILEKDLNN
jgi:DNA invertase Pin-like site-specific DNA recombinase